MSHPVSVEEVAGGVFAYLQRGSWGFSNAGLIVDSGSSLLVDTLYDVALTRRMLSELARSTPLSGRVDAVVNTHANGDHCWGNQAVDGARLIASRKAAEEMKTLSPKLMASLVQGSRAILRGGKGVERLLGLLGRVGVPKVGALADAAEFVVRAFGPFDFGSVSLRIPTETFEGKLELNVGSKRVTLLEVGPAHTLGDVLVHVPEDRVVFTGDILFMGSHPIMWEGPVQNWIRACDRILSLDVDVVVPGHGPITTKDGVRQTKAYWEALVELCKNGLAAGTPPDEIARALYARGYAGWDESSRVAVNIDTICRDLQGQHGHRDPLLLLAKMARLERPT
jgi:glyoxylase-like metal-dependent hydrolase (beta-lactamase superfamily II)